VGFVGSDLNVPLGPLIYEISGVLKQGSAQPTGHNGGVVLFCFGGEADELRQNFQQNFKISLEIFILEQSTIRYFT
jgi:Tat protein secretion system quality control protein TatD with DNase activity